MAGIEEPGLRTASLHYPSAGGKGLRPAITVMACEAAGGRADDADPLAIAVELLHTFSLVHDDLMDRDDVRRGVPSVHKAYDEATAILAGDALFAMAFEALGRLQPESVGPTLVSLLARTARTLCEGQAMDMAFEARWPTLDEYETMITKKTAVLFACAASGAGRIAGADEGTVSALDRFGRSLGLGFQVQDDVLDLVGDTETLGKPQGSDVLAGKRTHPLIVARERASAEDAERLGHILELRGSGVRDEDVAWVVEQCRATGALQDSTRRYRGLLEGAVSALRELPSSPARKDLEGLVDWVAGRDR